MSPWDFWLPLSYRANPGTLNTSCEDIQSRAPTGEHLQHDDRKDVEIHDNTLKVNFNTNAINPKNYSKYHVGETNRPIKLRIKLVENNEGTSNIFEEPSKDPDIAWTLRSIELC